MQNCYENTVSSFAVSFTSRFRKGRLLLKQKKNCSVEWQGGDDDRMIMAVKSYASICIVFVSRNVVVVVGGGVVVW